MPPPPKKTAREKEREVDREMERASKCENVPGRGECCEIPLNMLRFHSSDAILFASCFLLLLLLLQLIRRARAGWNVGGRYSCADADAVTAAATAAAAAVGGDGTSPG